MQDKHKVGNHKQRIDWQRQYQDLICICEQEGTLVLQDSVIQNNPEFRLKVFYKNGVQEYVFPPQEVTLARDNSRCMDTTPGREIKMDEREFNFDEESVIGHIRIEYTHAGNKPVINLYDVRGDSQLPEEVARTLTDFLG